MVTATSPGPRRRRLRQRAASASSAVESGPPETASSSARALARSAKRTSASASDSGYSAAGTLLFSLGGLLHTVRRARILVDDFAQRRAGEFALMQGRERLAEAQQRIGSLRVPFVFFRHVEERGRGVAVILALEHALAKPKLCVRCHPIARVALEEVTQRVLGKRVVLAQQVAVTEIVGVARRLRRGLGSRCVGIARRRRRERTHRRPGRRQRRGG